MKDPGYERTLSLVRSCMHFEFYNLGSEAWSRRGLSIISGNCVFIAVTFTSGPAQIRVPAGWVMFTPINRALSPLGVKSYSPILWKRWTSLIVRAVCTFFIQDRQKCKGNIEQNWSTCLLFLPCGRKLAIACSDLVFLCPLGLFFDEYTTEYFLFTYIL